MVNNRKNRNALKMELRAKFNNCPPEVTFFKARSLGKSVTVYNYFGLQIKLLLRARGFTEGRKGCGLYRQLKAISLHA